MRAHSRSHFGAVVLIVLGTVFLLVNLGIAPAAEIKAFFAQWWPAALVIVGVWLLVRPRREHR